MGGRATVCMYRGCVSKAKHENVILLSKRSGSFFISPPDPTPSLTTNGRAPHLTLSRAVDPLSRCHSQAHTQHLGRASLNTQTHHDTSAAGCLPRRALAAWPRPRLLAPGRTLSDSGSGCCRDHRPCGRGGGVGRPWARRRRGRDRDGGGPASRPALVAGRDGGPVWIGGLCGWCQRHQPPASRCCGRGSCRAARCGCPS